MSATPVEAVSRSPRTRGERGDRALPASAHVFLTAVALGAAALAGYSVVAGTVGRVDWLLFALLAGGATISQLLVVKSPAHQAYYTTAVFFVAAAMLLPLSLVVATVVVAHVVEWARHRYPWYIQTFNIANYSVAAGLAHVAVVVVAGPHLISPSVPAAVAGAAAAIVFVALNHALLAQMLRLARGTSYRESGLFEPANLATELVLALLGVGAATVVAVAPAFAPFVLAPLVLVHRALALPSLEAAARTDSKTDLFNARHFEQALADELERAGRFVRPLSVVLADLDLLRDVNNTYGHLAGDAVLRGVASIIKSQIRDYDIAARFGGEEYAIVLPETGHEEALEIADRIRAVVADTPFLLPNGKGAIRASVSLGVASYPEHTSPQELVDAADAALYRSKALGRNRVSGTSASAGAVELPPADPAAAPPSLALPSPPPLPEAPPRAAEPSARPSLRVVELVGAMVVAAGVAFGLLAGDIATTVTTMPLTTLTFLCLSVGLQLMCTSVYGRGSETPSVVAMLASGFVLGPGAALAIALVTAAIHCARRRGRGYRAAFDLANFALSAAAGTVVFHALVEPGRSLVFSFGAALVAGFAHKAVNVGLLCTAISLDERVSMRYVWRERFQWAWLHYLASGPLAFAAALAYERIGVIGLLTFSLPPALLAFSMRQYVERTRESVEHIRQVNQRLAESHDRVRRMHLETVAALARSMEAKDDYSGAHIDRVRTIAVALAQKFGFKGEDLDAIEVGALMHDIGKIGIPEQILTKAGPLTPDEWTLMKRHPVISDYILSGIELHPFVRQIVRSSHERVDGRGYPDGLSGEAIPLPARIVFVADAFDALTSDRPYRRGRSVAEAFDELRLNAGTQFCPAVVAALELVWRDAPEVLVFEAPEDTRPALRLVGVA